jgi:uncharacterized protein YecT (DUF1311 family)
MKILLLALALAAPAAAQTQADLNRQTGRDHARADAALNTAYRAAMARMARSDGYRAPDATTGPGYRNALLASQRAWLAYRDAECVIEGYEFRGGSAEGMALGQCRTRLTRERTRLLDTLQQPR